MPTEIKSKNDTVDQVLGLKGESPDGQIKVGTTIALMGKVMRIHESGVIIVEVAGKAQPAILVLVENVRPVTDLMPK